MLDASQILFEDNHLFVLNKPAGLLTQPSGTDRESLEGWAKQWIKEVCLKPGNVFLEAVHRLDRPASGIVVFGKTRKALTRLNASIRDQKMVQKTYRAFVEGHFPQENGLLQHFLAHDDFHARVVDASHPQAKIARLSYRVIERFKAASLLEIALETGRYHQIRLQFAAMGHPILGDVKYGSRIPFFGEGIALHHLRLTLPHPTTRAWMTFEAPLPKSFSLIV